MSLNIYLVLSTLSVTLVVAFAQY